MNACLIYPGHTRTWGRCRANQEANLQPFPSVIVHYNEHHAELVKYTPDDWRHYYENKVPESWPENSINMWHNMYQAFQMAPAGLDCYVRSRYDIILSGPIDFRNYDMRPDVVYIPQGNDYRDGVNDQFAFGSYEAMNKYFDVFNMHPAHFAAGKTFHTESYLRYTLDAHRIKVVRIPATNTIVRP